MKKALVYFCITCLMSPLAFTQKLVRGPYLQLVTSNSVCVKIHLDGKKKAKITYGENLNSASFTQVSNVDTVAHDFKLKNLAPLKKYYYKIYIADSLVFGDANTFFITNPAPGSSPSMRFVVLGDCGSGNAAQAEIATAAQQFLKSKDINGLILLGDNAYNDGFLAEYQRNFFDIFDKKVIHNVALWPSPGNHEYADKRPLLASLEQRPAYYHLFDTPTLGESGGLPSGDEAYYAFDMGNVHFISLDSYGYQDGLGLADSNSRQRKWLAADLAQNKAMWTIAFFHHPPFSMGSHDSDTEVELVKLREGLVPLLDKYKVDVVLNGHSHNYERSFLMQGHYGMEASFDTLKHAVSQSTARHNGTPNSCPFVNKAEGTIYNVSGAASRWGYFRPSYPHNAMRFSNSDGPGASIIEVDSNKLALKYINVKGEVLDAYTFFKGVNNIQTYTAECGDEIQLKPSFISDYAFPAGLRVSPTLRIDSVLNNTAFAYTDMHKCMIDSVKLSVKAFPKPKASISKISVIEGEEVSFTAEGKGTLTWQGPDKKPVEAKDFKIEKASLTDAGVYRVSSSYKKCFSKDSVSLSVQKRILASEPDMEKILAYPNPSEQLIYLDFEMESNGDLNYSIFNAAGKRIIKSEKRDLKSGTNNIPMDISYLNLGAYTIFISTKERKKSIRFVKK